MEHETFSQPEKQPIQAMLISDGLSRYYEAHGTNPSYETISSEIIEGHEVAWMKYSGNVVYDVLDKGRENEPYEGYAFKCACEFTEGVGWYFDEDYNGPIGTLSASKCEARAIAQQARNDQLRSEYLSRKMLENIDNDQLDSVSKIMLDLIDKSKNHEFLETYSGANFWGGHYYLQLVESITGLEMWNLYDIANKLENDGVITMNGAVVCEYRKPSPPSWEKYAEIDSGGWKVVMSMPTHDKMRQTWKFDVYNPSGELIDIDIPELPMLYAPVFGPDADDLRAAQDAVDQILKQIISKNKGQ